MRHLLVCTCPSCRPVKRGIAESWWELLGKFGQVIIWLAIIYGTIWTIFTLRG